MWRYHDKNTLWGICFITSTMKLESSDQKTSQSAGKNTGIVLKPCCIWKCVPTAISGGEDISEVPGRH